MEELAKQINDALDHDFKDVPKLRASPFKNNPPPIDPMPPTDKPTVTAMIDATIAYLEAQIKALHEVRRRL
jgi:cyanate lyase